MSKQTNTGKKRDISGSQSYDRKLNELCRMDFMRHTLASVLVDMSVCELNGWDKFELPQLLYNEMGKILAERNLFNSK